MPKHENEPRTTHIWLPDHRSLCDRRARKRRPSFEGLDETALVAHVDEQLSAPVCGACIFVALYLRVEAGRLVADLVVNGHTIHPPTPSDALRSIEGTRWALLLDLDHDFGDRLDDAAIYQNGVTNGYGQTWLQAAAVDAIADRNRYPDQVLADWKTHVATLMAATADPVEPDEMLIATLPTDDDGDPSTT